MNLFEPAQPEPVSPKMEAALAFNHIANMVQAALGRQKLTVDGRPALDLQGWIDSGFVARPPLL